MGISWKDKLLKALRITSTNNNMEVQAQRCEGILNYWLDIELFDLPECPFYNAKKLLSIEADQFIAIIEHEILQKLVENPQYINDESRLNIMFQCHRAGYVLPADKANEYGSVRPKPNNDYSSNPNLNIPRTYLVSHSFVPKWDPASKKLLWSLSTDSQDMTVNLATIRMIYRKCPPKSAHNLRFSQWIQLMVEEVETLFNTRFINEETGNQFTTEQLQKIIIQVNRDLTKLFWPEQQTIEYMNQYCGSLETGLDSDIKEIDIDEKDRPVHLKDGSMTFRWRFCFYPEGNTTQQLGPFYVRDLEHSIEQIRKFGVDGLSKPLREYLLGCSEPQLIPDASNNGKLFVDLTKDVPLGRWPENPNYGLSLLQKVAVNVALDSESNPVIAVNGPPGTGKTTLLKDVIATKFVTRTIKICKLMESKHYFPLNESEFSSSDKKDSWFTSPEVRDILMENSIIVSSSNNKAVENISKELPAKSSIDSKYLDQLSHFGNLAPSGDWGLFCAVLGNAKNRKEFKFQLSKVQKHLDYINDTFNLNQLVSLLKKHKTTVKRVEAIEYIIEKWKDESLIPPLVIDLEQCSNRKKHKTFFDPFIKALVAIEDGTLLINEFILHWEQYSDDDIRWEEIIRSLDAVRKQWFAKKLYLKHQFNKLNRAKLDFYNCLNEREKTKNWQLDPMEHLLDSNSYKVELGEDLEKQERELHLRAPFASPKLNDHRSRLFIAALAFNEALIEAYAADFLSFWDDLKDVIDGSLVSNEEIPYHSQLWSVLFLIFPVVSTSLSSIESQFKQMQKKQGFGIAMIDEAGQAVNYHVAGLLQRSRQAVFVGDPIQLEPVVTMHSEIDFNIAKDHIPLSDEYNKKEWGDEFIVSTSSAQSVADLAGRYYAMLGERRVGIPLLVHRRCLEPMFSIANKIAYKDKMVSATYTGSIDGKQIIPSGWINVEESSIKGAAGYGNEAEAEAALDLVKHLVSSHQDMIEAGIFIITPFSKMRATLRNEWMRRAKVSGNAEWMSLASGTGKEGKTIKDFANENIGTVHTFQGKEASVVILCLAASEVRKKMGGIKWVNSKPNLLNVAVTRAKNHLFIIGNMNDWRDGSLSKELQSDDMMVYSSLEDFLSAPTTVYQNLSQYIRDNKRPPPPSFDFGA